MKQAVHEKVYILESVRTNTFKESFAADAGAVWQTASARFTESAVKYGIYHNYESDFKGDYDLTVAVDSPQSGDSMTLEGNYHIFPVDMNGENPIVAAWAQIWAQPLRRAYTKDFEKYSPDGTVSIYIAVLD